MTTADKSEKSVKISYCTSAREELLKISFIPGIVIGWEHPVEGQGNCIGKKKKKKMQFSAWKIFRIIEVSIWNHFCEYSSDFFFCLLCHSALYYRVSSISDISDTVY